MNVSKTFTPQVYHHIFHRWRLLKRHIIDSVFAESLRALCGTLPGRGDFIVKSPMEQTVEEKKKDNFFKNLWIVFLYNVIAW